MTIEQKAKAYDEALEKARCYYTGANGNEDMITITTTIFPELKESEDERIKKDLLCYLHTLPNHFSHNGSLVVEWIAWLEKKGEHVEINPTEFDTRLQALIGKFETLPKEELVGSLSFWLNVVQNDGTYKREEKQGEQKLLNNDKYQTVSVEILDRLYESEKELEQLKQREQKPTDKIEPKFKNGQWIVWQNKCYKVNYNGCGYELIDQNGLSTSLKYVTVDENAHLWTIQDAKDGDVLAWNDSKCIAIFKNIYDEDSFNSYGFVGGCTGTFESRQSYHDIEGAHPATKEQRDTLMKAMADAGYTFDFEKKELKKIEQKSAEWSEEDEKMVNDIIAAIDSLYYHGMVKWLKSIKYRVIPQPQQDWNNKDEIMKVHTIDIIKKYWNSLPDTDYSENEIAESCYYWLKSLNSKIQPKQEWGEEDERIFGSFLHKLEVCDLLSNKEIRWAKRRLKYLRPQNHWKPTEAQLASLTIACDRNDRIGFDLTELLKDLKKL